jgi:transposase
MATERLSMRQTREILRQKWSLGRTHREVAQSLGISSGAVGTTVLRARAAGLDWAQVGTLSDEALQARVYGPPTPPTHHRAVPDCAYLHAERRKPGVTLELLHLEYLEQHPDGYRYTQFCEFYRRWLQRRGLSMRQVHRAGEKCFVDYAGQKPTIIEATTGEVIAVELFVAVLGASNYTYAEVTRTQQVPDWIANHQRAFQFFGGVPAVIVPDQLKSGVVVPCRYEPGVQRTTTTSRNITAPSSCPPGRRNHGTSVRLHTAAPSVCAMQKEVVSVSPETSTASTLSAEPHKRRGFHTPDAVG